MKEREENKYACAVNVPGNVADNFNRSFLTPQCLCNNSYAKEGSSEYEGSMGCDGIIRFNSFKERESLKRMEDGGITIIYVLITIMY